MGGARTPSTRAGAARSRVLEAVRAGDDLGQAEFQEDLTDFLIGLDDVWGEAETMGAKCVAEGYPKQS